MLTIKLQHDARKCVQVEKHPNSTHLPQRISQAEWQSRKSEPWIPSTQICRSSWAKTENYWPQDLQDLPLSLSLKTLKSGPSRICSTWTTAIIAPSHNCNISINKWTWTTESLQSWFKSAFGEVLVTISWVSSIFKSNRSQMNQTWYRCS